MIARSVAAFAVVLAMASPAFAADPTVPQCLQANENAIARRKESKLRETKAQLQLCAAATCPGEVREECNRRLFDLKTAIPTLVLGAKSAAGADLTEVTVTMDGQPFATRLDGMPKDVDPGEHVFTFETQGAAKLEQRYTLKEGEKARQSVVFGAAPASPGTTLPPTAKANEIGPLKVGGLITAGIGVIVFGVGAVFGVSAMLSKDQANCAKGVCADAEAKKVQERAVSQAELAGPVMIIGGVMTAAGAVVYFVAPSKTKDDAPAKTSGLGFGLARGGGATLHWSGSW